MARLSLCDHLFSYDETVSVSENRQHALFWQVVHRCDQIGVKRLSVAAELGANEIFAKPIINQAAHHQEGFDPALTLIRHLSQFILGGLCDPSDRAEPVKKTGCEVFGFVVPWAEQARQVAVTAVRCRLAWSRVPIPARITAIHTGARSITA